MPRDLSLVPNESHVFLHSAESNLSLFLEKRSKASKPAPALLSAMPTLIHVSLESEYSGPMMSTRPPRNPDDAHAAEAAEESGMTSGRSSDSHSSSTNCAT